MIPCRDENGQFKLLELPSDSLEQIQTEQLGSKDKKWIQLADDAHPWLLKFPRPCTGEHWAEKLAYELACIAGIPAAQVELVRIGEKLGTVCRNVIAHHQDEMNSLIQEGVLVHGNEVLAGWMPEYEKDKLRGQRDHTFANIINAIDATVTASDALQVKRSFAGLLMLDALIGNTDRHHENWALILNTDSDEYTLSPSYDHGSSLGRELTDEARRDKHKNIAKYVRNGKGAIYLDATSARSENPIELVRGASLKHPELFAEWLDHFKQLCEKEMLHVFDLMPDDVMSEAARSFCAKLVQYTLHELKGIAP